MTGTIKGKIWFEKSKWDGQTYMKSRINKRFWLDHKFVGLHMLECYLDKSKRYEITVKEIKS